ncbi:MAG: archaellin/type IV pilin N-terminal domain-containing protein [Candidatus Thorarchaeota archaeon]
MKSFTHFVYKKRAISPVIAVILLIGLAVAAAAAIFLIVLPLFTPSSNLQMDDAYVVYDDEYTTAADLEKGYGKGTLILSNTGTADIDIVSVKVYYASSVLGPWTEITEHDGLLISQTNPYTVETLATLDELNIRFLIPDENDDKAVFYRITITTSDGDELDTATEANVAETDMQLVKDRPDINYAGTLGYLRREEPIRPSQVSDNSEIKNVTYDVYFEGNDSLAHSETIQPPNTLWQWTWNTRKNTDDGLRNGSYYMIMTVNDYAGLSDMTDPIDFIIDNDYINPVITNIMGASVKNGLGTAEVGEFYAINASITDTGCQVSAIKEAYIYYKLNDTEITTYAAIKMDKGSGDTFYQNIPASFIDSTALDKNITFYINAEDDDSNQDTSSNDYAGVLDTTEPDFTAHIPVTTSVEQEAVSISATVTDKDEVSSVNLVWRERNDTGLLTSYGAWEVSTNVSGTGNTWEFQISSLNATIDGLDYYLNASDPTGNLAYDGSSSSPYHVVIPDELSPEITIRTPSPIPEVQTAGESLTISVYVSDHDLTFSRTGDTSGTVELGYRKYDGVTGFTYVSMNHILGDSSTGALGVWEAVIPAGTFTATGFARVDFNIRGKDASNNERITTDYSVTVLSGGTPIFEYVTGTVVLSGPSDGYLSFDIINSAGGTNPATGTLTDIQVDLYNRSKIVSNGEPYITKINVTGGDNPIWANSTNFEGANATKLTLDKTFNVAKGVTFTMDMIFANSSSGYYNLENFKVNVTLFYNYTTTGPQTGSTPLEFRTPLAEPDYTMYSPNVYSGHYYIGHWLASPLYDYGSSGLGWDLESQHPWTSEYSRKDIAEGLTFPYDDSSSNGLPAPTGDTGASHTINDWVHVVNNEGTNNYRMNIDNLVGGASYQYIWFYAVILVDNPNPTLSATMYLGSDDEAVCYINNGTQGEDAGNYPSPRGYGESTFVVTLKGQNQNNYILFGVHEDGGSYRGGLAFNVNFEIKIYDQGPPLAPIMADIKTNSPSMPTTLRISESQGIFEIDQIFLKNKGFNTLSVLDLFKDAISYCTIISIKEI